ncbi:MAG: hypothetical protein A2909_01930 [Candidatus Tagabacteria bacterium RIFCSPLOWO2_01_FULL_39_11]|uniref:Uncharacterized protein n=1 Tax=Candidatus Tagabacteria bacterium RIFCSPLOWO2_01_FULL_39_11 TaxID=1802295 RepID=A0A1G2LSB2_9BACT|nr:MAG: hypothetical protein A2909_01930 [Candidatus Tagabacteria bacterium RIFCSPLOWO2_01_FULL_39_11]
MLFGREFFIIDIIYLKNGFAGEIERILSETVAARTIRIGDTMSFEKAVAAEICRLEPECILRWVLHERGTKETIIFIGTRGRNFGILGEE